jgi:phosphoglycolate phosphatase-like HAD superfamily hydrolase
VRPLFAAALEEVFGTAGAIGSYSFAGRTDARIVLDLVTAAGVPAERVMAALPRVRDAFVARLEAGLEAGRMTILPGVVELLERLAAAPGVTVGLLTGNWRRGAEVKLSRLGLDRYFAFGAFGDDGIERADLPPVALDRAAAHAGRPFAPAEVLIVGDSTEDVACAAAHGLACLAVTTGWTSGEDLRVAGARWVMDDLPAAVACGCLPL